MIKTQMARLFFIMYLLLLSLSAQEKPLEKISIQLKWFYQYQFAGILVAKEKGFYEKAGLDVTIKERDPAFNNIMQVIDGESQYGIADSVILRYRAEGHPLKVIATIFQHNAMVLISKKESGIVSPYEMKGKKISYQEGLDDSIITSVLAFAGLKDKDFIKRPMDFTHMDFVNGQVDVSEAYISIEPYWMKKKHNIDLNIIDPKNYGIDFYGDLLFTTEEEIKNHPERVEAFKNATLEGWAYALQHKSEAIHIILDKYNTRDLNFEQLLYEARITENLIATDYIPLGEAKQERFKVLANLYHSRGLSKQSLDAAVDNIIYDPHKKSNLLHKYRYPVFIGTIILLFIVLLLIYYNRRLTHLVSIRTQELETSKHEAEQAAASKASFLANMSHEIRTPMNAILGFVEQLAKNETDPSRQQMFQTVEHSGQSLLTIINDILDISKIESGKMLLDYHHCDIHLFCNTLKELFKPSYESKNIQFHIRIEKNVPRCLNIDEIRLKQIMTNLISNAIKFTDKNGIISFDLSYTTEPPELEIFLSDTGIGIAHENIEKIFNIFEQEDSSTTRRFGGTGLGLAISKKLANMMNGDIHVSSKLGEGSRFYLHFPFTQCENFVPDDDKEYAKFPFESFEGKILVVEDNKTNQVLMGLILDELGLVYEVADNGQEAIDMFQKDPSYALILMDENMPVMNGIEAVKVIREIEAENKLDSLPIIAVTANALSHDKERFLDAGMDDYISKPYSEDTIRKILLKYLGT